MRPKTEKDLLPKVPRQKRGTVAGRCQESAASWMDGMDDGEKGKVAWCYDGGEEKQGCKEVQGTTQDDKTKPVIAG